MTITLTLNHTLITQLCHQDCKDSSTIRSHSYSRKIAIPFQFQTYASFFPRCVCATLIKLQRCYNIALLLHTLQRQNTSTFIHGGNRNHKQVQNYAIVKYSFFFLKISLQCIIDISCERLSLIVMTPNYSLNVQNQSCDSNAHYTVLSIDIFNSRLNMRIMNRHSYSISYTEDFLSLNFLFCYATTKLMALVAFGLKSAYRVHAQPYLLSNLSYWS